MIEEEDPLFLALDKPCPPALVPSDLGVCLTGTPDSLFLVVHEPMSGEELGSIRVGRYRVGLKLVKTRGVAGLAWHFCGMVIDMVGFAPYSLGLIRQQLGEASLKEAEMLAHRAIEQDEPDVGLPITIVFVRPRDSMIFALRMFTLPRLFSGLMLRAFLATADQDVEASLPVVRELLDAGPEIWRLGTPGVAVAGKEDIVEDRKWKDAIRRDRRKRRRR